MPVSGGDPLGPPLAAVEAAARCRSSTAARYAAPATITATTPAPNAADRSVVLRSANRARPLLTRNDQLRLAMDPDTTVVLNGLVLAGAPLVIEESAGRRAAQRSSCATARSCPGSRATPTARRSSVGRASLIVLHPFASVTLDHCIVGPVVAVEGAEVTANDSVIDATAEDEVAYCGRAPAGGGGAAHRLERGRPRDRRRARRRADT